MFTFCNWCAHVYMLRTPLYKNDYWMRAQQSERYIYTRTMCWCVDIVLAMFVTILLIELFLP